MDDVRFEWALCVKFSLCGIKDECKKTSCTVPTNVHSVGVLQLIFNDSRRLFLVKSCFHLPR